jgi:hypothetical protein
VRRLHSDATEHLKASVRSNEVGAVSVRGQSGDGEEGRALVRRAQQVARPLGGDTILRDADRMLGAAEFEAGAISPTEGSTGTGRESTSPA